MPRLVRLYIRHCAIGYGLSAAFVAMLLWFDVARLWTLASHDSAGALAVVLLWLFNGIVFAGVQFGIAVQRLGRDDTARPGGRRPAPVTGPALIPATVQRGRR